MCFKVFKSLYCTEDMVVALLRKLNLNIDNKFYRPQQVLATDQMSPNMRFIYFFKK